MAQEPAPAEVEVPKTKGKLLYIIIAVVALVLIGGATTAYLLSKGGDKKSKKHGEEDATAEDESDKGGANDEKHPPTYLKLETFTVNLAGPDSYLQTEVQLLLADPKTQENVVTHMPEIRDAVIRLLSKRSAEELSAADGKDKLADDMRKEINDILGYRKKNQGVKKVLFVAFIIQ